MTDHKLSPQPRRHLSRDKLAKLERRFRGRRQQTQASRRQEELHQLKRRQKRILAGSVLFAVVCAAVLQRVALRRGPVEHAAPEPPRRVPLFGADAHTPAGAVEMPAFLAPLKGLARGSRLAQNTQVQVAEERRLPVEIQNSIGMTFRLIPPGSYVQGSSLTEVGRGPDEAEHVTQVPRPLYMGAYEVTQRQWEAVMGRSSNPSCFRRNGSNRPVEEVTWRQCHAFAKALCAREHLPENSYRLPYESEWEYACRAGTQTPFCSGETRDDLTRFAEFIWNNNSGTAPVGQRRPNAWGLYDMHGNVWEWCRNNFGHYKNRKALDPLRKVVRGGNWRLPYLDCRSASRYRLPPDSKGNILGFRLVRVLADNTPKPTTAADR